MSAEDNTSQTPLEQLAERYFQASFEQFPLLATSLGIHDYDDELGDYSAAGLQAYAAKVGQIQAELVGIDQAALSVKERSDYQLLTANIEDSLLDIEQIKDWQRSPQLYADVAVYSIFLLLSREFAPLPQRLRSVEARLEQVSELLALGKEQVQNPPAIFTETAIEGASGAVGFLRQAVPMLANGLGKDDAALKQRVMEATETAAKAMEDYVTWLKDDLSQRSNGDFALRGLYQRKLELQHMVEQTPAQIEAWGKELFANTIEQLRDLAAELDPDKSWNEIIAETRRDHPTADGLLLAYRGETERLLAFIKRNQLVTVPEGDLEIVETPPFQRATYPYAGYAQPGAFDAVQTGQFWVTPVNLEGTPEQQEEQLEEHAWAWIPVIALHEGYPGHHLQLLYANQHSTYIRKHLGFSSLFVEGWALYCEQMMGEVGYYIDRKVKLSQLRGQLWRAARVVIDVGLQMGTMSVDEAISLLSDQVGFSRDSARGEVRRYTMTPGQPMSYLLGKDAILRLRDDAQTRWGATFTLQRFHDRLLSSGSIPMKLVREEFWADEG